MTSFYFVIPAPANWFQTNQPDHESDDRTLLLRVCVCVWVGGEGCGVCVWGGGGVWVGVWCVWVCVGVTNEKEMAFQRQNLINICHCIVVQ